MLKKLLIINEKINLKFVKSVKSDFLFNFVFFKYYFCQYCYIIFLKHYFQCRIKNIKKKSFLNFLIFYLISCFLNTDSVYIPLSLKKTLSKLNQN